MKALLVAAIFATITGNLYGSPYQSAANHQTSAQPQPTPNPVPVTVVVQNPEHSTPAETPKPKAPEENAAAEWTLVFVGIFTAAIIAWQAWETRRSVNAMQEQSRHIVNTERAWALVEIGEIPEWSPEPNRVEFLWIRPTIKNCGNTMARIKTIRAVVRLVPDGERLPQIPEYPLGQGMDLKGINLILIPNIPIQPIKLGISAEEFIEVRRSEKFLYIHGFIEYSDIMSPTERRTAFCFYYAVQSGFSPDPTRFYLELTAPPGYNEWT